MPLRTLNKKAWLKWPLIFVLWTLVGFSFAAQFYFTSAQLRYPVSWHLAVSNALTDWYLYALLSLPALWLARRCPLDAPNFWRNFTLHLLGSGAFSMLYMALRAWVGQRQAASLAGFSEIFDPLLVKTFHFNVLVYWIVVGLSSGLDYYRKFRERELRTIELEKRLAEARLQTLQTQLNPHFLFNTLNAIATLMHRDVDAADRMLVRLSELLRFALDATDTQEVALRRELEFLSRYLEIEQIRFGDRLSVEHEIAPDTLDALVPNLILQPIVENAIRHGIERHAAKGRITLRAQRERDRLLLRVQDNGAGLRQQSRTHKGIGLANARERLRHLYGQAQRLELCSGSGKGLLVEIELPFHTTPILMTYENSDADRG
ncbi:MAG: histidine kinase [Verrucomicrobia bacterium]|nr:histidine kinase [Verrucomicrobiota bacterium]